MAYYLVTAVPRQERIAELHRQLAADEFSGLRPFGQALTYALRGARLQPNGVAIWEEEDYCHPPLAQERAAVLDDYFADLKTERVERGVGWHRITALPKLFPEIETV